MSSYYDYVGADMEEWPTDKNKTKFDPSSVCAAVVDCVKNSREGLSPREIRLTLDYEFKGIRIGEILYAMQAMVKEGLIKESRDENGVFVYCGDLIL